MAVRHRKIGRTPVRQPASSNAWQRIYGIVRRIPAGRVATYGQIAALAGLPRQARVVGYALAGIGDGAGVPWHRVLNAQGRISARAAGPGASVLQRLRLEAEQVTFDARGRVDLERFGWKRK